MQSSTGSAKGLAPCLIGEFSALPAMRLGKFPNKLRYFLRKYPAACRLSVRLPFCGGCSCRLLTHITPPYFFPFGRWQGGRFHFQRLFCMGQSDTRFSRYIRSHRSKRKIYRETAQPPDLLADIKPRTCFAFINGNDLLRFPLKRGIEPAIYITIVICLHVGMLIYHHAFQRLLGLPSETTDTNTVVFSFRPCIILSNNALRTFAAPNDSIRKAREVIASRL